MHRRKLGVLVIRRNVEKVSWGNYYGLRHIFVQPLTTTHFLGHTSFTSKSTLKSLLMEEIYNWICFVCFPLWLSFSCISWVFHHIIVFNAHSCKDIFTSTSVIFQIIIRFVTYCDMEKNWFIWPVKKKLMFVWPKHHLHVQQLIALLLGCRYEPCEHKGCLLTAGTLTELGMAVVFVWFHAIT